MTNVLTKITYLGVLLGFFACLGACSAVDGFIINLDNDVNPGVEITDLELPAGFTFEFSANMMDYSVEAYSSENGSSHLYLIRIDENADPENLENMLDDLVIGSSGSQSRMPVIETRPVTISGQETNIVFTEGPNSEGVIYRQATITYQSNGSPTLLVFSELLENWDQAAFDALVVSIQ